MKSTIDQLVLNLDSMTFNLYLSYGGNQHNIPIEYEQGLMLQKNFAWLNVTNAILLDTIVDDKERIVYYVPHSTK